MLLSSGLLLVNLLLKIVNVESCVTNPVPVSNDLGCSFENGVEQSNFIAANLTCSFNNPGVSELCSAENGESFIINGGACPTTNSDSAVLGDFVLNGDTANPVGVESDLVYTCNNGVDTLAYIDSSGNPQTLTGVTQVGCPTNVCQFENGVEQSNFVGADLVCTLNSPGVSEVCEAKHGESFTVRGEACPTVSTDTAVLGDFIINGNVGSPVSVESDLVYSCNNGVDTLSYTDSNGNGVTLTNVTQIGCPTTTCSFTTSIPTGGFTNDDLTCSSLEAPFDDNTLNSIFNPNGVAQCTAAYGERFQIRHDACRNNMFLVNGAMVDLTGDPTGLSEYVCTSAGVDPILAPSLLATTSLLSIGCFEQSCQFANSLPAGSFRTISDGCTQCEFQTANTELCTVVKGTTITIVQDACGTKTTSGFDLAPAADIINPAADFTLTCDANGNIIESVGDGIVTSIACLPVCNIAVPNGNEDLLDFGPLPVCGAGVCCFVDAVGDYNVNGFDGNAPFCINQQWSVVDANGACTSFDNNAGDGAQISLDVPAPTVTCVSGVLTLTFTIDAAAQTTSITDVVAIKCGLCE